MIYSRPCPICHTSSKHASVFQKERIDKKQLSSFSYASRKEPEFMCHHLLRCMCDLIYASNPPPLDELASAYHHAEYDSAEEANDAAKTYIKYLQPIFNTLKNKKSVLEIGSGTGVFLELIKTLGFTELVGIEPSAAAIAAAPLHRQQWLRKEIFIENNFRPASFDLICCFMTMEHVYNPKQIALAVYRLLRPQGAFVTVTHDANSLINRLLGKRSPIIDIEHMQLFTKRSIHTLFTQCNFKNISIQPFVNHYSLAYWLRLTPFPKPLKNFLKWLIRSLGIHNRKIGMNVGNIITAGFKTNC